MSKECMWMWKCGFKMYKASEVGDLEQTCSLWSGRYSAPPCLLVVNFTKPW